MKPGSTNALRALTILFVAGALLTLVSWGQQQIPTGSVLQVKEDTTKKKKTKHKEVRDLDEAINELDEVDLDIHLENAMKEVAEAMKKLDVSAMKLEMDKAMKEVDFEKIKKEIDESMAKVDWEKIKEELEKVKEIDYSAIEVEMKKAKKEMGKIQPQIEKELKAAKVELEKAKKEMKEYKTFVDGLNSDGLINKKENYTIQHEDGKLLINGKEASLKTYQKYQDFLKKHPKINIRKDDNDFNIDLD